MHNKDARQRGSGLQAAGRWVMTVAFSSCVCALAAPLATAATPRADDIHIGAIVPESWPSAAQGHEIRNGMMLALKTWPGYPVPTLVIKDSACDPKRAAAAAQAMVEAKVDVVLGGWCVIGSVPPMLKGAGIPFVSSNAERYTPDGSVQFARLGANVAEGIASRLRTEAGLRVTANSICWIDFEPRVSEKYDAALCPTLSIDKARWQDIAPTYQAAFQAPFTVSAARGYAAMQVALAYVTRLRAGAKPAAAWSEAQAVNTVLGRIPARDAATPDDAMQLVFRGKLPKLAPREAGVLDQVVKAKGCGCKAGAACATSNAWSSQPFVITAANGGDCSQLVVTAAR